MKKIIVFLTVLMCLASVNAFAQLKEVRGVQTRVVEYQGDKKMAYHDWSENPEPGYKRHGFEFNNENNYSVWVETELYYSDGRIVDTKSFTLNAKESYVWKVGDKLIKSIYGEYTDCYDKYYVKYKAYKAE